MDNKRLLWIGDAGCPSGFALATHEILDVLHQTFDVTVLGINYLGDPHHWPYDMYAAAVGGDWMGVGRLRFMCELVEPDIIVIQQDPWNIPLYVQQLRARNSDGSFVTPQYASIKIVASVAVDGRNFDAKNLDDVDMTVFWTQWALDEARNCGFAGQAAIIPLGVNLEVFHPIDKYEARSRRLPKVFDDAFVVGNVNRNQPRKRLDLTMKFFAEWVKGQKINDAWLYLHVGPTGDTGVNIRQLARYYGIWDRLALMEPPVFQGISEMDLCDTYNCFDVSVTTTQGEGMGLTTMEAMACGVPVIAPNWAALSDWAKDAVWLVKCLTTAIGPPYTNVIGGVVDQDQFTHALNTLYQNPHYRQQNSAAGLERVQQARFRWPNIGRAYLEMMTQMLTVSAEITMIEEVVNGERKFTRT